MPASPKFCIFGAGAIGGMVATLLARSGATVSVVARGLGVPTPFIDSVLGLARLRANSLGLLDSAA